MKCKPEPMTCIGCGALPPKCSLPDDWKRRDYRAVGGAWAVEWVCAACFEVHGFFDPPEPLSRMELFPETYAQGGRS